MHPRDASRMLVVKDDAIHDASMQDFTSHLQPDDVVIFNNSRVIPARLIGKRGEAAIEILLHKKRQNEDNHIIWQCFAKPAKRLKPNDVIIFAENFNAVVLDKLADGQVILSFVQNDFFQKLTQYGQMPLPPYIEKKRAANQSDSTTYQTIYAKHDGSVAAPTAGLHFTAELLAAIDATGARCNYVTLHVGGGTFLPVKSEDTSQHVMHSEWAELSQETADMINQAKAKGGRIIAVGTTSLRTLESATNNNGIVQPFADETDIFITPGYQFKCVDMLLTNFHLPRSTLFMLVSAFSGLETMKKAYQHAIHKEYRFYSYGDACLLYMNQAT